MLPFSFLDLGCFDCGEKHNPSAPISFLLTRCRREAQSLYHFYGMLRNTATFLSTLWLSSFCAILFPLLCSQMSFSSLHCPVIKPNISSLTTSPPSSHILSSIFFFFFGFPRLLCPSSIKAIQSGRPVSASCVICQGDSNALFLFIFEQCPHYQCVRCMARQYWWSLSPVRNERGLSKTNNLLFLLKETEQVYQRRVKNDHPACCLSLPGHERDGFPWRGSSRLYFTWAGPNRRCNVTAWSREWALTPYKMIKLRVMLGEYQNAQVRAVCDDADKAEY